jgi:DGQHR domain-containing protein
MDLNQDIDTIEELAKLVSSNDYSGAIYIEHAENLIELLVPTNKISLIVDGQHRLSAMIKLYEDAKNDRIKIGRNALFHEYPDLTNEMVISQLEKFELNCTILLGFDKWEQGKVFADVNFNQKPVNKSLYYDIFGSFPDPNKNDIFLAHMLAMHLNNNENSVIKNSIKMLGTGNGYFSQAFFVEALLDHFGKQGIWNDIPLNYVNGGSEHKILPKVLKAYMSAIKSSYNDYWPKEDETTSRKYPHILLKTTGMGALLKLLDPIYRKLKPEIDFKSIDDAELIKIFVKQLEPSIDKASYYFSREGGYSGSGSKGQQNALYLELKKSLNL